MKLSFKTSIKHVQIDKARNNMLIVVAIASIVTAFSLLSAKALLSQSSYQHKVLKEKNKAIKQLKTNINAADTLKSQYDVFEAQDPNIIGGQGGTNPGNGPNDGDNARIVLDALPSQYDFPALTSSIEKIVTQENISVQGIGGTDDSAAVGTGASDSGGQSQAAPITFSLSALTDYNHSLSLIKDFERSIRPFDITNLTLSGSSKDINVTIQANTYYQPGISLQIGEKEVH